MKIKFLAAIFVAISLIYTSCFDAEEKIVINKDNSGTYSLTMDLGSMLKMMSQMGGQNDSGKIPQKKDSTIYFKSYVDTSKALSAEEKQMLKDGSARIKIDEANNEMKLVINLPFKNISQLPKLRESYMSAISKVGVMDKLTKKAGEENGQEEDAHKEMGANDRSIMPTQQAYTFSAVPGKISNKFTNKELFESTLANDSTIQMMQQMSAIMGEINYKTVFVLPKAAKKYSGNNAEVSADKKTITFKTVLADLLNRPESAEYEIEY